MGFGKFVVGGLCAVGAIVAAPVVLPAAGFAMAGSLATGAVGTTVGLGLATASSASLAAGAGLAAGAAGVAVAGSQEKKVNKAKNDGYCRGVKAGKEGLENVKNSYEKAIKSKDIELHKKDEIIEEQDIYIKEQDEFIDQEILSRKKIFSEENEEDCLEVEVDEDDADCVVLEIEDDECTKTDRVIEELLYAKERLKKMEFGIDTSEIFEISTTGIEKKYDEDKAYESDELDEACKNILEETANVIVSEYKKKRRIYYSSVMEIVKNNNSYLCDILEDLSMLINEILEEFKEEGEYIDTGRALQRKLSTEEVVLLSNMNKVDVSKYRNNKLQEEAKKILKKNLNTNQCGIKDIDDYFGYCFFTEGADECFIDDMTDAEKKMLSDVNTYIKYGYNKIIEEIDILLDDVRHRLIDDFDSFIKQLTV